MAKNMVKDSSVPMMHRGKSWYELKFTHGLPPGTDFLEQIHGQPRRPRPAAVPKRELPPLPPINERKSKWIARYMDQLDPATEYDQIVRVHRMFSPPNEFFPAILYCCTFIWLTSTPGGAHAFHNGKIIKRGHARFYETQIYEMVWSRYGSCSPETIHSIDKINRVHVNAWKRAPGTASFTWEAQGAILLLTWLETHLRRTCGAKSIHPKLKAAYPEWGERLTSHFKTEGSDKGAEESFGNNYPRSWDEIEAWMQWFQDFDWNEQRSEEDRRKGHETCEQFIHQFCELWFPRALHFLGRAFVLTMVPPKIRAKQSLEDPNPLLQWLIKLVFGIVINLADRADDPVEPLNERRHDELESWNLFKLDAKEKVYRDRQERSIQVVGLVASGVLLFAMLRVYLV